MKTIGKKKYIVTRTFNEDVGRVGSFAGILSGLIAAVPLPGRLIPLYGSTPPFDAFLFMMAWIGTMVTMGLIGYFLCGWLFSRTEMQEL
jgi:polyferredoxin